MLGAHQERGKIKYVQLRFSNGSIYICHKDIHWVCGDVFTRLVQPSMDVVVRVGRIFRATVAPARANANSNARGRLRHDLHEVQRDHKAIYLRVCEWVTVGGSWKDESRVLAKLFKQ